MKAFVATATLAVLLALPTGMALVSTSDVTDLVGPAPTEIGEWPAYYVEDDASVWEETNGLPGLQREAQHDENGDEIAPADTLFFSTGMFGL